MDKQTKEYRENQLGRCKNSKYFAPTVKLHGSLEGSTHCLSITLDEFVAIKKILLDE